MRVSDGGPDLVKRASVGPSYGITDVAWTANLACEPSARTMVSSSPCLTRPSFQNTAGPLVQSRCPSITALPTSPGVTPGLYQPTFSGRDGVAMRPLASRPSDSTGAFTPIAGTKRRCGATAGATIA